VCRQFDFSAYPGVVDDGATFALEDAVLELKTTVGFFAQSWASRSAAGLIGAALMTATVTSASAATFDCVMDPSLTVKLGSPVSSILSDVLVDRGDRVKKDQPIARIESSVEQAVVAINKARASSSAEIQAKQAMLDAKAGVFKRKSDLLTKNVASAQDVETAQAEFNVATQDLALAKLNRQMAELELARSQALLDQRTIRSPLDGIVMQRALGPGEFVRPEANVITIAKVDPLYVEAYLPVRYFGKIKVGDTGAVRPNEPIGGSYNAIVSIVDEVFDAASGTFGVRLNLPNPDYRLPGGLRCHVDFDVPEMTQSDADTAESSRR
jgi:RND family efflux transporter MFP subunit